jgi:Outer membrane protein beta-barrel domain
MKKIFILSFVTLISFTAFAQKGSNIKFGVKAGVTFPTFAVSGSDQEESKPKSITSLFFGGNVDFAVSPIFSIQPGLSIIGKGVKISENDGNGSSLIFTRNVMYLEIPVNAVANFKAGSGKFFIGAGPYVGFAISGKDKVEATDGGQSMSVTNTLKFGTANDSDLKSTDFGLNFLGGYELSNGLNINAGYGLGLTNLNPKSDENDKGSNRVFSVGLGFSF